ncbi:hypothetical protein ABW19_dt0201960 [Dactylella cylindrospora]|nr:hypothetical protein ABW19_dt0201960 [Dactylella cylindrospora]
MRNLQLAALTAPLLLGSAYAAPRQPFSGKRGSGLLVERNYDQCGPTTYTVITPKPGMKPTPITKQFQPVYSCIPEYVVCDSKDKAKTNCETAYTTTSYRWLSTEVPCYSGVATVTRVDEPVTIAAYPTNKIETCYCDRPGPCYYGGSTTHVSRPTSFPYVNSGWNYHVAPYSDYYKWYSGDYSEDFTGCKGGNCGYGSIATNGGKGGYGPGSNGGYVPHGGKGKYLPGGEGGHVPHGGKSEYEQGGPGGYPTHGGKNSYVNGGPGGYLPPPEGSKEYEYGGNGVYPPQGGKQYEHGGKVGYPPQVGKEYEHSGPGEYPPHGGKGGLQHGGKTGYPPQGSKEYEHGVPGGYPTHGGKGGYEQGGKVVYPTNGGKEYEQGGKVVYPPHGDKEYQPGGKVVYPPHGGKEYQPNGKVVYPAKGGQEHHPGGYEYPPQGGKVYTPGEYGGYPPQAGKEYMPGGKGSYGHGGIEVHGGQGSYVPPGGQGGYEQGSKGGWWPYGGKGDHRQPGKESYSKGWWGWWGKGGYDYDHGKGGYGLDTWGHGGKVGWGKGWKSLEVECHSCMNGVCDIYPLDLITKTYIQTYTYQVPYFIDRYFPHPTVLCIDHLGITITISTQTSIKTTLTGVTTVSSTCTTTETNSVTRHETATPSPPHGSGEYFYLGTDLSAKYIGKGDSKTQSFVVCSNNRCSIQSGCDGATLFYLNSLQQLAVAANKNSMVYANNPDISAGSGPFQLGTGEITTAFGCAGGMLTWTYYGFPDDAQASFCKKPDNSLEVVYQHGGETPDCIPVKLIRIDKNYDGCRVSSSSSSASSTSSFDPTSSDTAVISASVTSSGSSSIPSSASSLASSSGLTSAQRTSSGSSSAPTSGITSGSSSDASSNLE